MKFYHYLILICHIFFFTTSVHAADINIKELSLNQDTVKTCVDCHNVLISKKIVHAPLEDACDNCHSPNGNTHPNNNTKGFSLADDIPTLCFYCHEEYSQKNIHAPAEAGECAMCHNPHSSDNNKLLNESRTDKLCFECHEMDIPETDVIHGPVKKGACHECHDSHQSDNRSFLIDPAPQLCFNCHVSVEEQLQARNLHAPFEDDCSNCHKSHSSEQRGLLTEEVPTLCFNCHENYTQKNIHAPVESGECSICHSSHGSNNRSFLKDKTPQLCFSCHSSVEEQLQAKNIHAPFEDDCSNCHKSHSSEQRGLLTEEVPTLCFNCHENYTQKNIHAPAESGECSMCHSSHSTDNIKLLKESRTDKLCFECHDLEIPETNIVHDPVKEGACDECHDSHQSNNRAFLKDKSPQLCFNCHGSIEDQMQSRKLHAPFEDDCSNCHQSHNAAEKGLVNEKTPTLCFNCHDGIQEELANLKNIHKPMSDKKSCNNCHSPHASKENAILLMPERDLCLSCHGRTYTTESGKTKNIKQKLKLGNNIHAPVEEGCVICHKPHAGNNFTMLNNEFPSGSYADAKEENFALCFECHDSGLLLSEYTTDATNFRNGNVNMHYIHIKGEKGRSCNTCHDSHGAKEKFLINDKVLFGKWEMDMNFVVNEFGGSCATGCHAEEKYDRSIKPIVISNDTTVKELMKPAAPQNRYQNFTEHIQAIDSSVIKLNEKMERDFARKNDSIDRVLLAQNDSIAKSNLDTLIVLKESNLDTTEIELDKTLPLIVESKEEDKPKEKLLIIKDTIIVPTAKPIKEVIKQFEFPIINFAFSKSEIDKKGEKDIIEVANYLKKNPSINIELHGYSDSIGSPIYNLSLSQLRAKQVKYFLVKYGVENHRIGVKGLGEIKAQLPAENSQKRVEDRRVEFVINQKE